MITPRERANQTHRKQLSALSLISISENPHQILAISASKKLDAFEMSETQVSKGVVQTHEVNVVLPHPCSGPPIH